MSKQDSKVPSLCEDTVQVSFFSPGLKSNVTAWKKLCDNINKTIKILSNEYIWHKQDIKVRVVVTDDANNIPIYLESTTCFGDNIEDEWYIVYLVKEISKQHKDLIIRLEDSDGEFLLIESANYLPSWANPENTLNRVFLHNQHIHMISPTMVELNGNLKLLDAIKLISHYPEQTKVSPKIEDAIFSRVGKYPQKMIENFHNAIVKVPLDIATLLTINPSFISPIVDAYCNHDISDLKNCQNLDYEDTVLVKVKFTRCLYAMLMHARPIGNIKNKFLESNKEEVLGAKLTYGLNMIQKRITADKFSTKEFARYINNLKQNGYFLQNIVHSKEYEHLMHKAKQYFLDTEFPTSCYLSTAISQTMMSDKFLKLKDTLKHKNMITEHLDEDSDHWLNISPNQLNDLLRNQYKEQINFNKEELVTPHTISSKLTNFLKETSDFEGVEIHAPHESDSEQIEFDSDEFVNCLEKMMNLSSGNNVQDVFSDSDFELDNGDTDEEDNELEKELASKLISATDDRTSCKTVMFNLTQSIKEEDLSGPSSNLLKSIEKHKTDNNILDSDDD